ncbi:tetratricopeptide repeat protein [Vulcaniibacterium thermophilum]|uniref:Membrane protein n=1 Tax=Vulcaniibacterium thermophilum TaxID=1169913 RepID=A0A918ZBM3_9GAMM|nr:tetratricopeptide repeat protein [Vulcaniibacterium thermophilum]GHE44158.1 membrane protein [Vulcaniibacterium thermophilum]
MPARARTRLFIVAICAVLSIQAVAAEPARAPLPRDRIARALEPALVGEFALQAGRLKEAAAAYLEAARAAEDAELASRATRIALLAKDDARTAQALALWKRLAPPEDALALRGAEAVLALRRNDTATARAQLNALLAAPGEDGWKQALAVLSTGTREPAQAVPILRRLINEGRIPDHLPAWLAFGGLAQQLEQPQLAERVVDEVVRRFPGEPRVGLLRANQLREAGRTDEARAALRELEPKLAGDATLRRLLADEYFRLRDYAEAERLLAAGPQDEQTIAQRAALLAQAEDKAGLARLYGELKADAARPDPGRRLLLGRMAEFLERHAEALDWYEGVPGGPQRWQARLRSANVLHELDRKREAYDRLRAIQSDAAAEEEVRRDAYLLEAALYQKDGETAAEMDAYARGLAAFPDEPEILYARALSYERQDDIPRAEADLRRILVIDPDNVAALNALGYTLADRTTRYQEALELIDRARAAEPESGAIVDSYGWVLYRLGRHKEALVELRRALTLQKDPEIAAHLAEVLWVSGQREEAMKYFEMARKLDPENRALRRALEKTGARLPAAPAPAARTGGDA